MIIVERSYIVMDDEQIWVKDDSYTDSIYYDGKFIGTAISKQLKFTAVNDRSFRQKEFVYYRQSQVDGVWQTAEKMGTFIVTDIEPNDTFNEVTVTALDYMLKAHINYNPSVTFPATLQAVYDDLVEQMGITAGTTALDINGEFLVDSNQYEGELCVTVLQDIAEITGNYAHINADDELILAFHSASVVGSISADEYATLIDKKDSTPITVVTLENSAVTGENWGEEWQEGIDLYGVNEYLISDNEIAYTQAKREALAPAILDKIKGWAYAGFEANDCFRRDLHVGDLVNIIDLDGTTTQSIVLRVEYEPKKGKLSAPSFVKASINYYATKDPLKLVEVIVDKAEQSIRLINQELTDVNGSLTQLSNTIQQNKDSTDITISQTGGYNLIRNSAFYKGSEFWETTGTYQVTASTETERETESGTKIAIDGTVTQSGIKTISGQIYTLAGHWDNSLTVTVNGQSGVTTWTAAGDTTLSISGIGTFYDMRIVKGSSSLAWTQHADEVYGRGVLIDNTGVTVRSLERDVSVVVDPDSFEVKQSGTTVAEVSAERVASEAGDFSERVVIGDNIWIRYDTHKLMLTEG